MDSLENLAVETQNLHKSFKTGTIILDVLKGINIEIKIGEILMIVGPSGCGKTTLLSIIAGTLNFDEGKVTVLDTSLNNLDQQQLTLFRKKNIGFIFQQFHLIKTLSCVENVLIPLLLNDIPYHEALNQATAMLEKVGLKNRENEYPKTLSGGQQQRVAIARALVHNPKLIICDEPTSSLDAETGATIMDLLDEIVANSDRTVIIVTHDNRIFKYADRILHMDDGKIREIHSNGVIEKNHE